MVGAGEDGPDYVCNGLEVVRDMKLENYERFFALAWAWGSKQCGMGSSRLREFVVNHDVM